MRGGQGSLSAIPSVTFSATEFMVFTDPLYTPVTIQTTPTIQMLRFPKNIFNLETGVAIYLFNKQIRLFIRIKLDPIHRHSGFQNFSRILFAPPQKEKRVAEISRVYKIFFLLWRHLNQFFSQNIRNRQRRGYIFFLNTIRLCIHVGSRTGFRWFLSR